MCLHPEGWDAERCGEMPTAAVLLLVLLLAVLVVLLLLLVMPVLLLPRVFCSC